MAAPTLTLAASGTNGTATTSHEVSLPAGTADKVIWFLAFESGDTTAPDASATDWTVAKTYAISQAQVLYVLIRAATSETSVTVTTVESSYAAWVGGSTDGDIANAVFTDGVTGSGATNDPDAVTVDSGDYRVGAMVAYRNGSRALNSYPTNYDDNQVNPRIGGSSRPGLGLATRGLTGITSEDPGSFGMHGGSGANIASTMAIPEASGGLNAPGSPSATPNSTSQITVDWTDTNTSETGYRVERSPAGEDDWADVSGNLDPDTEQYVDTGLDAGTSYDYRIFAFDGGGDGPASSTVSARTDSEQYGSLPLAAVIGQWDARDLPGSDNDPVASWPDVGPKAQDPLAQATGSKQPVIDDSDGIRWVLFDGSDDFLTNTLDQSYNGDFAAVVVAEPLTYPTGSAAVLYSTGFIIPLEKNILGIDGVESGWPNGAWVVMSGPEGTQAEHHHGTNFSLDSEIPGRRFVQSQLVRNAGEHRLWENNELVIDEADSAQGDSLNNLAGMRLGAREDETRHMHARVGFVLLVDMSEATQAQLLSARDALMSDFGVAEGTTGSGSGTLPAVDGSGSGTVEVSGSGPGVLGAVAGDGSGDVEVSGSGSGELPAVEGSGSAAAEVSGSGSGQLPAFAGSGSGGTSDQISGSGSGQLPAVEGSGSATTEVSGSGAGALGAVGGSGSGEVVVDGSGTGELPAFSGSGSGNVGDAISGSGAGQLPAVEGSGSGTTEVSGSGSGTLGAVAGDGTGEVTVEGSGSGTLPGVDGAGSGAVVVSGSGAGTLPALAGSGSMSEGPESDIDVEIFAPVTQWAISQPVSEWDTAELESRWSTGRPVKT